MWSVCGQSRPRFVATPERPSRWKDAAYEAHEVKWRTLSRNLEATSKRDANKKATQLHRQLEEEAECAKLRVLLVMDEDEAVLERFLEKYISGIEGSGQIERTTAAGYRSSAAHICRYLEDVRIDDITADMIVAMQRRLLTEDGLCPDSVAYVECV